MIDDARLAALVVVGQLLLAQVNVEHSLVGGDDFDERAEAPINVLSFVGGLPLRHSSSTSSWATVLRFHTVLACGLQHEVGVERRARRWMLSQEQPLEDAMQIARLCLGTRLGARRSEWGAGGRQTPSAQRGAGQGRRSRHGVPQRRAGGHSRDPVRALPARRKARHPGDRPGATSESRRSGALNVDCAGRSPGGRSLQSLHPRPTAPAQSDLSASERAGSLVSDHGAIGRALDQRAHEAPKPVARRSRSAQGKREPRIARDGPHLQRRCG